MNQSIILDVMFYEPKGQGDRGKQNYRQKHTLKISLLIGSMNRAVILGRIYVMFAANILARYSCAPHYRHLKTALRAFGYLEHHPKKV